MPGSVGLHALVGQFRARDLATQLLQRLAVFGAAAHGGVKAEAVDVGAQRLLEVCVPRHRTLQRQHLLAGAWAEGDALRKGGGLQRPERAGLVRVAVAIGNACNI